MSEPGPPPDAAGAGRAAPRSRAGVLRWLPAVVAALAVAALGWALVIQLASWRGRAGSTAQARDELVSSVTSGLTVVSSYDYRHLDRDEVAAAAWLTGPFKAQYTVSMDRTVKPAAAEQHLVVTARITASGVVAATGDQASVLVFGQQAVTSATSARPQLDPVTVLVTAERVHGHWLIANIVRK